MASTTVKLLQIRTAVLVAPRAALMDLLAAAKSPKVPAAVNQIGAEQAAEEHDFGGQEDPHAEAGGVALLLLGGEVVQQCRVVSCSSCLNGRRLVLSGNWDLLSWVLRRSRRSCRLPKSRRALLKVESRGRRWRLPLQAGGVPRIVGRGLAVAHRPQEVDHGQQVTDCRARWRRRSRAR